MRPSGDTARGLVFDDFVDKQVVHVSATSFRSGAELVSMYEVCMCTAAGMCFRGTQVETRDYVAKQRQNTCIVNYGTM